MIAQNEVNVQGKLTNITDNHTASFKSCAMRIFFNLNNGACMNIQYPTVEVKHIWKVYVTSELKTKLFCFFTIRSLEWIFIAVKNRYLNLLTALKFTKTWNEPIRAETK